MELTGRHISTCAGRTRSPLPSLTGGRTAGAAIIRRPPPAGQPPLSTGRRGAITARPNAPAPTHGWPLVYSRPRIGTGRSPAGPLARPAPPGSPVRHRTTA
ncbi:hypothetical protein GCM10027440_55680 [Nocardiopsis coralliicola]